MSFEDGLILGYHWGKRQGGGSSEQEPEWTPPDDWLTVPEPMANEACFLVEITDNEKSIYIQFADPKYSNTGKGTLIIDWGDGNTETLVGGTIDETGSYGDSWDPPAHTYSETGQYVIKCTTDIYCCLLMHIGGKTYTDYCNTLLIAKLGANIVLESTIYSNYYGSFLRCCRLKWISINGNPKLPKNCFSYCYALKRLDILNKIIEIPERCFNYCYSFKFKNMDFSEVTKINNYGLSGCYNLEKISALKCASVDSYAFSDCYALETAEFAEGCAFSADAFFNCYSLRSRPDGSIS